MAEGGDFTDMLTCSLCLNRFTEPRALPCLHTFCLQCLQQFVDASKSFKKLKCPLCNELHDIPSDGVNAFRQDFRIKNLVELEEKKNAVKVDSSGTAGILKIDMCGSHPELGKEFFCKNRECDRAIICAKCWVQSHPQHDVVPLKQEYEEIVSKVKKAKTCLLQIEENTQKVMRVKENLEQNRIEMRTKVSTRVQEYQEMLAELADEVLSDIEKKTNEGIRKATQEMDLLLIIQEELRDADIDLDDNIETILARGSELSDNLKDIQTSVEEWEFTCSRPVVASCSVSAADMIDFDKTFSGVTMDEEEFKSKAAKDGTKRTSRQTSKETPQKKDPVQPKPSTANSNARKPPVAQKTSAQQISNISFRDIDKIDQIAYYTMAGVENLTLKGDSPAYVAVYSLLLADEPHLISYEVPVDLASFGAQSNGQHFLLNREDCEVSIHNWPLNLDEHTGKQDTKNQTTSNLCCTANHYFYCFKQDGTIRVACMSTERKPPKFMWSASTGLDKVRAINAMENENGIITVLATKIAYGTKVQTKDVGLVALNAHGILWQLTYEQIENGAKMFDFRSIDNDGQNFYLLNTKSKSVYIISPGGQILNKVLKNLTKPICLSINREVKKLAVVENDNYIKVYKLNYV